MSSSSSNSGVDACGSPACRHWVIQQARNVTGGLADAEVAVRFLVRDRDTKYTETFDEVFRSKGATILRTPYRTPNANAIAERFVRSVRSECLDHLLIVNRGHLEPVLRSYIRLYNDHRPHQGIDQQIPTSDSPAVKSGASLPCRCRHDRVVRHDRLEGLIHEYECAA